MTKTHRLALEWFARQPGPVGLFGANDPSLKMRRRMVELGHIRKIMPEGFLRFVKYEITPEGRAALPPPKK